MKDYAIADYPGYFGKRRDQKHQEFDDKYGKGSWVIARAVQGRIITDEASMMLYEDGFYHHLKNNGDVLEWLINTASDVYDNAETNVLSGLDYRVQENKSNHLQDIAIRRTLVRLGTWFRGDHLVRVREPESEGFRLQPGQVPFHMPYLIRSPRKEGWWLPGSIEDFWQANKVVAVKKEGTAKRPLESRVV
jgi:hypothetical protein